jgi:uncharacterized membrane protein YccC
MPLPERLGSTIAAVRAQGRLVARLLIAALLSYALAQALDLPQSYWATITALVVVQASVGATMGAGIDRIIGTLIGAAVGALAALGRYRGVSDLILLGAALTPLAMLAAVRPVYRIAPITAVIALLAGSDLQAPWVPALHRVAEISLGSLVGMAVSLVVWPSHARELARAALARALAPQADLLSLYLSGFDGVAQAQIHLLNDRFRQELGAAERARAETAREPGGQGDRLESLTRAVRRVHSDILFIGRITQRLPRQALPGELQQLAQAYGNALRLALSALAAGIAPAQQERGAPRATPSARSAAIDAALADLDAKLSHLTQALRSAHAALPQEAILLPIIAQILRRDLGGLADTIAQRPGTAA